MPLAQFAILVVLLCCSTVAAAQSGPTAVGTVDDRPRRQRRSDESGGGRPVSTAGPATSTSADDPDRSRRRPGRAFLQVTAINAGYGLANLVRGQVTARVTPASWWRNLQRGWVWDLDRFLVNQIGHPYQGSQYFLAGRSNGLGFYESAALAAFGSGTWEYFGETNHPSLNDFLNTTLGGVALGEMLHRTARLIRSSRERDPSRWRELTAAAVDPITGLNRFIDRTSSRVANEPADLASSMTGVASIGILRRGNNLRSTPATIDPFAQVDLTYGPGDAGRSRTPFDAFGVRLMAGGGGSLTEARVRGRLMAEPMLDDRMQLSVVQSYHYLGNDAYRFGAQAFEMHLTGRRAVSSRLTLELEGWGGFTVLGAIDSRPLRPPAPSIVADGEPAGQGVSEGPRNYDYGPGTTFGASATVAHDGQSFASAQYEGRTLYSLDGVRANHVLQRARLDIIIPVHGRLGVGATGEYFDRRSLYQDAAATVRRYYFPQTRLYLTWRLP